MNTVNVAERFRALHRPGAPLVMPNPWDAGSARLLAALGFPALATTSSGFAATLGQADGSISREQALEHAGRIVAAVDVPVSADLEDGFADPPAEVAATVEGAAAVGLAGCSIEDFSRDNGILDAELAADRIAAAVQAGAGRLVITARAENFLHGRPDLADTIDRLQRFQQAGADVLYAPGLRRPEDIATVVKSVDRPVNVLLVPDGPTVPELAELGVGRVSIGGTFAYAAYGALAEAARDLLHGRTYTFWDRAADGRNLISSVAGRG